MYAVGTMEKMSWVFINIWYTTQIPVELLLDKAGINTVEYEVGRKIK